MNIINLLIIVMLTQDATKSLHTCWKNDSQNTIILEDTNIYQHFRALANHISFKKKAYF